MSRRIPTADEFLQSPALSRKVVDVPVPELGEGVVIPVWGMTPKERSAFEDRVNRMPKDAQEAFNKQLRERLVVECCRDDAGQPLFNAAQVDAIGNLGAAVVERIVNVAFEISGFSKVDLEQLAKKSDAAPAG